MGLHLQNGKIVTGTNNEVTIYAEQGYVKKRFYSFSQYQQEIRFSEIQDQSLILKFVEKNDQDMYLVYKYIKANMFLPEEAISSIKQLHSLPIDGLIKLALPKSIQVSAIEKILYKKGVPLLNSALIHGDLTPSNILCTSSGPQLIDYEEMCISDPLIDLGVFFIESCDYYDSFYDFESLFFKKYQYFEVQKRYKVYKKEIFSACLIVLESWWNDNNSFSCSTYERFKALIKGISL